MKGVHIWISEEKVGTFEQDHKMVNLYWNTQQTPNKVCLSFLVVVRQFCCSQKKRRREQRYSPQTHPSIVGHKRRDPDGGRRRKKPRTHGTLDPSICYQPQRPANFIPVALERLRENQFITRGQRMTSDIEKIKKNLEAQFFEVNPHCTSSFLYTSTARIFGCLS